MNTRDVADTLAALMSELVNGSPDPANPTSMLNRGDSGLIRSLEKLTAAQASASVDGGASIAAHTDHIIYGLSLLNRWVGGEREPWKGADWTQSWRRGTVDDAAWRTLLDDLRRETQMWIDALRTPRELNDTALRWVVGSVPHLAYHLGAIRQIQRAARGPTAEDERNAEQALAAR